MQLRSDLARSFVFESLVMAQMFGSVAALLFSVGLLIAGTGLQMALVPIRAEIEGFDSLTFALMTSAFFGGYAFGCLVGPYAVLRAGHIRSFTAMVSLASAAALAHPLLPDPMVWIAARAISGVCMAGIFLVVESWLNDRATNENRGMVMSAYIIVYFTMQTAGQMIVSLIEPGGFPLFVIASILVSLAVIPVAMTRSAQPAPMSVVRLRFFGLYKISPVGFLGSLASGMSVGVFWAYGAVFATRSGFDINSAVYFVSAMVAGGALMQWPVGRLSDTMDRRFVLLGLMIIAASFAILLASVTLPLQWLLGAGALFGAFFLPIYSVVTAHTYDFVEDDSYVEAAAGIILVNSVGAIIGPFVAAYTITWFGIGGMFVTIATILTAMILFTAVRVTIRPAMPDQDKTDYDFYSTAPAGVVITPEPLEESDPDVVVPDEWSPYEEDDETVDQPEGDVIGSMPDEDDGRARV